MDKLITFNSSLNEKLSVKKANDLLQSPMLDEYEYWKLAAFKRSLNLFQEQITYTTNVFIPVTFLCRNNCLYCGYRHSKVKKGEEFLKPLEVEKILSIAKKSEVSEVLLTMGEKPESKYLEAEKWLKKYKFESVIDYTHFIANKSLNLGLLPHINAGSLSFEELKELRKVSASMGLMLEILGKRFTKQGMPHAASPDKHPKRRLSTIRNAGKLKIPFTSGILIGIGETSKEIVSSLFSLRNIHIKYKHLQEVIIQNFQPHPNSKMANYPPASIDLLERVVIIARHILPAEISIQVSPNLIKGHESRFLQAGISDWGGISQISHDYINPTHSWPSISQLNKISQINGFKLRERLPIYPRYINLRWLTRRVYNLIYSKNLKDEDGYRKRIN